MLMVSKDHNLQRHHNDKQLPAKEFPCIYNQRCTTTARSCAAQTACPAVFAKKIQRLSDSETVKGCMLAMVDEGINDDDV